MSGITRYQKSWSVGLLVCWIVKNQTCGLFQYFFISSQALLKAQALGILIACVTLNRQEAHGPHRSNDEPVQIHKQSINPLRELNGSYL